MSGVALEHEWIIDAFDSKYLEATSQEDKFKKTNRRREIERNGVGSTHVSGYPGNLEVISFVVRVSIELGIIEIPFDGVEIVCLQVVTAV